MALPLRAGDYFAAVRGCDGESGLSFDLKVTRTRWVYRHRARARFDLCACACMGGDGETKTRFDLGRARAGQM